MNTRLWPIMRKEFIHIVRDPRTLAVMFIIPVVQLILLGYAATTDIRHLAIAVFDADHTAQSRQLVEAYRASDYFAISAYVNDESEIARLLDGGQVRGGLIIPPGYADSLLKGRAAQVAFVIDGSDPSVAGTAFAASQSVGQAQGVKLIQQRLGVDFSSLGGIEVRPRVWYNPDLRSSNYMVPALIGLILQFLTGLFTALSIVREREQGTIEQLVVTPIRSWELIVGKIIPYVGIAFFDLGEILLIGVLWFGVPVRGSIPLLAAIALLFLLTTLGTGLFISSVTKSQQEAMLVSFLVLFPGIFLSGFFFPLEAMPAPLQAVSYVVPLRYMLIIIRGIILKGVGLPAFQEQVIALAILGPLILIGASLRFRKSLE
ncbi:MAG: ABC transporter permease [Chloroflexi bacterium]|nr:ABC transporter permease [Chloroflexota bacterium]